MFSELYTKLVNFFDRRPLEIFLSCALFGLLLVAYMSVNGKTHMFVLQDCHHWFHLGTIPANEIPKNIREELIKEHEEEIKRLREPDQKVQGCYLNTLYKV